MVDQLPWLKFLNLWHRGEPLVAPDFAAMVAEASRRSIWTQTHTNGILLSRANLAEEIVDAGLNRIIIGVDGADEETYTRIRRGGTLAEVKAGVVALVEARRKLGRCKPKIVSECLVTSQSPESFRAVYDMALSWGCDKVHFKTYRVPKIDNLAESLQLLPANPKKWRYEQVNGHLKMALRRADCRRLGYSTVVAWNGEVLPCCFSTNDFHSMGNAYKQSFKEIWRGGQLKEFQRVINNGGRERVPMCRNCTEGLKRLYLPKKLVCR